jgi:hypothetical protein
MEYMVKDWNPNDEELFAVGGKVAVPLSAAAFADKQGNPVVEYTISRSNSSAGEDFQLIAACSERAIQPASAHMAD